MRQEASDKHRGRELYVGLSDAIRSLGNLPLLLYVAMAFILLFATPVSIVPKYVFDVTVTATETKDPRAKSGEVWLIAPGYQVLDSWLNKLKVPDGWEKKRGVLVSYRNQPASLNFSFAGDLDSYISFAAHEYSGIAKIEINGHPIEINLYSDMATQRVINLSSYADSTKRDFIGTYGKLVATFFIYFALIFWAGQRIRFRSDPVVAESATEVSWRKAVILALPSFVTYLIVHLIYWPGQLSPDSIDQWHQIVGGTYSDNHPVVGTLIYRVATVFYGSPAAPIILQYALLALVVGLLLSEFSMWGIRRSVVWFMAFLIPLYPANSLIAVTLWKDVLYSVLSLYLVFAGFVILRKDWVVTRRFLASVFVAAMLLTTVRHNGAIVAPLVLLIWGVVRFRLKAGRILVYQAVAVVGLFLVIKVLVNPLLGVSPVGQHYKAINAAHIIGGMVNRDVNLSESDKRLLNGLMPLADWKAKYQCQSVVPIFWARGGEGFDYFARNVREFNILALQLIIENPLAFIAHQSCVASIIWRIKALDSDWIPISPGEITEMNGNEKLGLVARSFFPSVRDTLNQWVERNVVNSSILGRPAIWMYSMLFLAVLFSAANGWRYLILLCPAVLTTVSLSLLALSPDYRYHFPVVMTSFFLIPFFLLSKRI